LGATETIYIVAAIPLLIWVYLLAARGGLWRIASRSASLPTPPTPPPRKVVVLIPAQNEASLIAAAVPDPGEGDDGEESSLSTERHPSTRS
jgi:hypothetical protein